ncbi:MAG: hypothetical protein CL793_07575 [Chloroflexi bacterium]|nr:hypothetical protein [Chloroflexota bacterium]|tara:strand:- start:3246 stop:3680 length:435 start_codon:yes stop_codon:yes gene_type:complete
MPKAKTKRGRVYQTANWLQENFPCPMPVELRFVRAATLKPSERCFGWCEKRGRRARITIVFASAWPTGLLIDTLAHEWAHAMLIQPARWEAKAGLTSAGRDRPRELFPHDPAFGVVYAGIHEALHDHDPPGTVESWSYPEKYRP